jgi:hypothetical protein
MHHFQQLVILELEVVCMVRLGNYYTVLILQDPVELVPYFLLDFLVEDLAQVFAFQMLVHRLIHTESLQAFVILNLVEVYHNR